MNKGEARHELSNIETVYDFVNYEIKSYSNFLLQIEVSEKQLRKIEDYRFHVLEKFSRASKKSIVLINKMMKHLPDGEFTGEENTDIEL